ncbi:MAG: DNA translocase FtsK [Bacteroidales bacterium]|nr:DNA translocase FtsK [Bacteroidales bacterium]
MVENKNRLRTPAAEPKELPEKTTTKKGGSKGNADAHKTAKKNSNTVAKRKKESDGRGRICTGIFLVIVGLFFLIAYARRYFGIADTKETGEFIAKIGTFMSEEMFGIGTIYLLFLWFYFSIKLIFKKIEISGWTLWKYAMVFLIWIPLFMALILNTNNPDHNIFIGRFGSTLFDDYLYPYIGTVGIVLLLIFSAITYVIFTFDIKFDFLKRKKEPVENEDEADNDTECDDEDVISGQTNYESAEKPQEVELELNDDDDEEEDIEIQVIKKTELQEKEEDTPKVNEIDLSDENEVSEEDVFVKEESIEESDESDEDTDVIAEVPSEDKTDDISMEITENQEEKQVEENGEHFGLDTLYDPKFELSTYKLPPLDLLKDYGDGTAVVDRDELEANKNRIVETLKNYSITIDKIKATIGPTVTLYEIVPAAGVRISKIKGLQDDIALCLSAIGIRIIAPIPGKGTVGIEVPNQKPQIVSMRSIISSEKFQKSSYELPFGIGKTITNESYVADLTKMPHILMAGATGQGKSVGINAIIASLLYCKHPSELKFVLVDPKKVELSLYQKIERHYLAKLPDAEEAIITNVKNVVRTLNSLCIEMDNRYELLKDAGVRNIKEYNAKFISRKLNPYDGHHFMPYIVLVIDEFADLIITAGKEVETPITRLAQLARAIGIHIIIATQRPSVNVITGLIKANFPGRIAFRVFSRIDSMTILDSNGADQLVGRGDMLISTGNDFVRLQCPFIDTPEVEAICDYIGDQRGYPEAFLLPDCPDEQEDGGSSKEMTDPNERDPLFEDAARIIVQTQQGSTSMLQRKLKLGYNRAGRIIDQLEKAGIVGPFAGSKQREVKVATEFALEQFLKDLNLEDNIKNNGVL